MITFGFSAFLKLLCLSDRRQRSEIRARLTARGGGYDFHRSLKLLCRRYSNGQITLAEGIQITEALTKVPERRSARLGLEAYANWSRRDVITPPVASATYESPEHRFRVSYTPDFCQGIDGRLTAAHIWNTATPPLDERSVYMALHLAADAYVDARSAPQDLAVLDLRARRLYRLADAAVTLETAHGLAVRLDALFSEIETEFNERTERPSDRPGDQPGR